MAKNQHHKESYISTITRKVCFKDVSLEIIKSKNFDILTIYITEFRHQNFDDLLGRNYHNGGIYRDYIVHYFNEEFSLFMEPSSDEKNYNTICLFGSQK